jgi:hypothetical protein
VANQNPPFTPFHPQIFGRESQYTYTTYDTPCAGFLPEGWMVKMPAENIFKLRKAYQIFFVKGLFFFLPIF